MARDATQLQLHQDVTLGDTLRKWLPDKLVPDAHSDFAIDDLDAPDAGFSGQTVFFNASWTADDGTRESRELVLRMQSSDHQLFTEPDALRQAEVMQALGSHPGVVTPHIVLTESDPAVLGAPFYLMTRVRGRVPSDIPSWHKRGWTVELDADDRRRMYDNALRALVAVHAVDDEETLTVLRDPVQKSEDTALRRYLARLHDWYEVRRPELIVGEDVLSEAWKVLSSFSPDTDAETVVWGDARVGNMAFAQDLSVAALFDWETASTGPAEIDLGWWLMFERFLCESLGFTRMEGVPDDDAIVRRYLELGGHIDTDLRYYTVLAAFVFSLITNRLALLLVQNGLDEETARSYAESAVSLVRHYLDEFTS
ncbi:phosphotransferase family protein [Rhodococcus chondri]|uniref:Phosphotransferase family protein n=1 Tax=Rhodococcus chondri TaxID=3065941 RepID=A0ABU7JLG1_9NOCA|nr:phosphotransferase family protein [Rhodococcus sp. CC-R104]MEE2030874.1 phosphotransferase family protein [Rhodococcus sp. CC-R104]